MIDNVAVFIHEIIENVADDTSLDHRLAIFLRHIANPIGVVSVSMPPQDSRATLQTSAIWKIGQGRNAQEGHGGSALNQR